MDIAADVRVQKLSLGPSVDTCAMWVEGNATFLPKNRKILVELVTSYISLQPESQTCSPRFTKFINYYLDPRITELDSKVQLIADYLKKTA